MAHSLDDKQLVSLNIVRRRFRRQMRSKLKKRIASHGFVSRQERMRYGLKVTNDFKSRVLSRRNELPKIEIVVPEILCFHKNPKATGIFFDNLQKRLDKKSPKSFFISHHNTQQLSLAASFVFDDLIQSDREYWLRKGIVIHVSGKISQSKVVNNFLLSYGFLRTLNIDARKFGQSLIDFDYATKYVTFKIEGSRSREHMMSVASYTLMRYFNACFNHNGMEIEKDTQNRLVESIGEIIGNAEEHSGDEDSKWYALGCYDKDTRCCSFAIINTGASVYESLSSDTSTAVGVIEKFEEILEKKKSIYERIRDSVAGRRVDEPLWNVIALQDGISSKRPDLGKGNTRGRGIMDVLDFIDGVRPTAQNGAEISLISGHSIINVDYAYPIVEKEVGSNRALRRLIYFNNEESFQHPPDPAKVMESQYKYPGTIFSGMFRIDETFLRKKSQNGTTRN